MARRVALLANPTAGAGRSSRALGPALDRLRARGLDVEVLTPGGAAHAAELARSAVEDSVDALVAMGGDGTVHLAAQAVVGTGVPLGIVPVGTGNDAARMLGLPADPVSAADVVADGVSARIDVGRVGNRVFLTVLSSGFDSRVNERANRMSRPRGPSRYRVAMLAELRVFRAVPYEVVLDDQQWSTSAMLVAVGNGPMYGGGMRVCPAARLDDGLLDVTLVLPVTTGRFLRIFPSVYRGEHVRSPVVRTARARQVTLTAAGMTAYADGEPFGSLPVTVTAESAALTVLVPAGSEWQRRTVSR